MALVLSYFNPAILQTETAFIEKNVRIQRLKNAVIHVAFKFRFSDHVSPSREYAHMFLMEHVSSMMPFWAYSTKFETSKNHSTSVRDSYCTGVADRHTHHGGWLLFYRVRLEVERRDFSYFGPILYATCWYLTIYF